MSNSSLKAIIEGFIFASDKAMSVDRIISLFPENEEPEKQDVVSALEELQKDYEGRGIELNKVSTGYRFQVRQEFTPWVSRLWDEKPARYTRALLETLALIVYRQPITRGEIEEIRGVAVSTNIIKTLQEREWVRVVGHRDVPGRPALYATTKDFLNYFNLETLDQLPPLSDIKDLDTIVSELDPDKNSELIEAIEEMKTAENLEVETDIVEEESVAAEENEKAEIEEKNPESDEKAFENEQEISPEPSEEMLESNETTVENERVNNPEQETTEIVADNKNAEAEDQTMNLETSDSDVVEREALVVDEEVS